MSVRLSQIQRLVALVRQAEKSTRKLASVQRRVCALCLSMGDITLTADTLAALEKMLAGATEAITGMQDALLAAREAADNASGAAVVVATSEAMSEGDGNE